MTARNALLLAIFVTAPLVAAPLPVPVSPPEAILADTAKAGREQFLREQEDALKSSAILSAALRKPELKDYLPTPRPADPVAWLRANIEVERQEKAGTLKVRARAGSRREQAALVNAVVDAYMDAVVKAERLSTEQQLDKLRKSRARVAEDLERVRLALARVPPPPPPPVDPKVLRGIQAEENALRETVRGLEIHLRLLDKKIVELQKMPVVLPRMTLLHRAQPEPTRD